MRDQLYAIVRKAIVTGKLAPGAPINEIAIAKKMGVSRTPVREAVKKVSDEGLIDVFAQNGTFVAEISKEQVEEAYIIRIALEVESIKRAAQRIGKEEIERLEDIIAAQEIANRRGRFDAAIVHDDNFHRTIAEVSGLKMLWKVIDVSKAQMDRCRLLSLPSEGAGQQTIEQHQDILDALKKHDEAASVAALKRHLTTSWKNTRQLLLAH